MSHTHYTHKDILKIFPDLKARTLISWIERGLVRPEIVDASGRGTRRKYSYKNLVEIGFVRELLGYQIPFRKIQNFTWGLSPAIEKYGFDLVFCFHRIPNMEIDFDPMRYIPLEELVEASATELLKGIILSGPGAGSPTSLILVNLAEIRKHIEGKLKQK